MSDRQKSYADRFGDGLEYVLASGAETLAEIASGLNEIGVGGPKGERWNEALLESEFERLAPAEER
jgi:hypothetical protein